jgi:hypothetical protein
MGTVAWADDYKEFQAIARRPIAQLLAIAAFGLMAIVFAANHEWVFFAPAMAFIVLGAWNLVRMRRSWRTQLSVARVLGQCNCQDSQQCPPMTSRRAADALRCTQR